MLPAFVLQTPSKTSILTECMNCDYHCVLWNWDWKKNQTRKPILCNLFKYIPRLFICDDFTCECHSCSQTLCCIYTTKTLCSLTQLKVIFVLLHADIYFTKSDGMVSWANPPFYESKTDHWDALSNRQPAALTRQTRQWTYLSYCVYPFCCR